MLSLIRGIFSILAELILTGYSLISLYVLQPPAFPRDTPESIKEHIEEEYLLPRLDPDEFSAEKDGRQWKFDWFGRAEVPLEPSVPRSVMVPKWELPFRRQKKGSEKGIWEPTSVQVSDLSDMQHQY